MSIDIVGWDVGGAHLKAALIDNEGMIQKVLQVPCPLWLGINELTKAMETIIQLFAGDVPIHAITMTGELVDGFTSREEGVAAIVQVMSDHLGDTQITFFGGATVFYSADEAINAAMKVASANWLATGSWLASKYPKGLMIDVGSTTTDLIPFAEGRVYTRGYTDQERLQHQELVYTGIVRTSLMGLVNQLPFNGEWVSIMTEHFATTADVYRILQMLPLEADQHSTADGADKTVVASTARLARLLGTDVGKASDEIWTGVAHYIKEQQLRIISDAGYRLLSREGLQNDAPLVGAGTGRFLVEEMAQRMNRPYLDMDNLFKPISAVVGFKPSDCAPAVAVAQLLRKTQ